MLIADGMTQPVKAGAACTAMAAAGGAVVVGAAVVVVVVVVGATTVNEKMAAPSGEFMFQLVPATLLVQLIVAVPPVDPEVKGMVATWAIAGAKALPVRVNVSGSAIQRLSDTSVIGPSPGLVTVTVAVSNVSGSSGVTLMV